MAASAAEEQVSWSSWAGSPELIAHIAGTAESALGEGVAVPVGGPPAQASIDFRATVKVGRDAEVFDSPQAFLAGMTPEARAGCQSIELSAASDGLTVRVVFTFANDRRAGVRLRAWAAEQTRWEEVATIAATVAMAVQRGFRRHLGKVEFSPGLSEGNVGVRARLAGPIEFLTPFLLGAATGVAVTVFLKKFFPDARVSSDRWSLLAPVLGALYPLWLFYAVPNVELAVDGKTRLRRARNWALIALATLVLTTLGKSLLGAE